MNGRPSHGRTLAFLLLCLAVLAGACGKDDPAAPASPAPPVPLHKATLLGSGVSPAHHPGFTAQDIEDFFDLAASACGHVVFITEWVDEVPDATVTLLMGEARERDLDFHLYLSPIEISATRDAPAVPPSVTGTSFGDAAVRAAFIGRALSLAALAPDLLGLGTEVNFLAANATEFAHYVSLYQEAVSVVRSQYPAQSCTVSFQWDRMILPPQDFTALVLFRDLPAAGRPDVFAFTTYPSLFGEAALIPDAYYSSVRLLLPTQALGFSEAGWSAPDEASRTEQAAYWARMPALMRDAAPSFVSMSLMHDVVLFTGPLEPLNHTGVRFNDGSPKPAWSVVSDLVF